MIKIIAFIITLGTLIISCKKEEETPSNTTTTTSDCPTTSACGCSNLNQADCNTNCCAWYTGQGCDCR